jgi:hypothetical protein
MKMEKGKGKREERRGEKRKEKRETPVGHHQHVYPV